MTASCRYVELCITAIPFAAVQWGSMAFNAHGLEAPQKRVSASSILLRNQLLATGRFLSVLPDFVLRHNAKQWSLKALPIDLGVKPRSVAIVTLKNRTVSPVVQLFVEHLRAVAKTMFAPSGAGRGARGKAERAPL